MKSRLFLVVFLSYFFVFSSAHAQISVTGGLELSPSTDNPVPGQTVTITARSYTIDINAAKVTWVVDGKVVRSATGATSLEVIAPILGKKMSIEVTAVNTDGTVIKNSFTLGSGFVDLVFETDGYTPPFFRGKLSPVYQNTIKIAAIAHVANSAGIEYDPSSLVYQWKKNGRVIEDQSGYGKQYVLIAGDVVPRPYDISVTVWPRDNSASAVAYASVQSGTPSIGFYVDDATYGPLFNRSITNTVYVGQQKEVTVFGVPFGFNAVDTPETEWNWGINNLKRDTLSSKKSVILRAPEGSSGTSQVRLNIGSTERILQGATSGFSVIFSNQKETNATTF